MKNERIKNYAEFWPFYLSQHEKKATRLLHLFGTLMGSCFLLYFFLTADFSFLLVSLLSGYGTAWVSHFMIEKNRPATFQYPLWSFISDYRMAYLMICGKL